MSHPLFPSYAAFSRGKKTAAGATPFAQFIPPYRPSSGAPVGVNTTADPLVNRGVIHVTDFRYVVPTTAHLITVMRPLNYTTFSADAAASQAVVNITADPGLYQTAGRYQYAKPGGLTAPSTANNAIAGNDYVVYQAAAGQWVMDTVSSVASLAVTLTNNLPTGGVLKGGLLYFFGIYSDTDPATNEAHQSFDVLAASSGTENYVLQSQGGGSLFQAYHPGDPMIFYSSNATAAGFIELIAGYYGKH